MSKPPDIRPDDIESDSDSKADNNLRYIAFYLPQFHPIPENDAWWGKGFTEWTNVTKAQPLFSDHYQPHLPTELGFYDLRLPEIRHEQIRLARSHGIDAFCFHYYWFNGKRLLEKPLFDFLADEKADIPFCLCWANESWSRRWDGGESCILMEQRYSPENDIEFIKDLLPFLRDSRYLKVNNAPLFIVYRPQKIAHIRETIANWRKYCLEQGIGKIHLVAALTHGNQDYQELGFDAGVEFPPHSIYIAPEKNLSTKVNSPHILEGRIYDYSVFATCYLQNDYRESNVYRTVSPSWDNTARTGTRSLALLEGNPRNYEKWLSMATQSTIAERLPEERLVFINAWNEWAEGCHLEPDRKFGREFLEATLRAKLNHSNVNMAWETSPYSAIPETCIVPCKNVEIENAAVPSRHILKERVAARLTHFPFLYHCARFSFRFARFFYRGAKRFKALAFQP